MLFSIPFVVLVHLAAASLMVDDLKTGNSYDRLSPRLGPISLPDVRDQRMTHWEPRAHSNFGDEDDNGDMGQTSYSPILQEPSSLFRVPVDIPVPSKTVSRNFDMVKKVLKGEVSRVDRCIVELFPRKPIISWLLYSGEKQSGTEDGIGFPSGIAKYLIPRCHHMATQNRRIQEPVYVEEPGWILLEVDRESGESSETSNEKDPFYVARGKRSTSEESENSEEDTNELDSFENHLKKYLLTNGGKISSMTMKTRQGHSYLQPRDKHSDILDILNEPFFISRGKKDSLQRSESIDDYLTTLVNYKTSRKILDNWRPGTKKNCPPDSDCFYLDSKAIGPGKDSRGRRGNVEELLKSTDPFYLARGKRSSDEASDSKFTGNHKKLPISTH